MLEKCDICGVTSISKGTLRCNICEKKVCTHHEYEQYEKHSLTGYHSSSLSYNYPDGTSFSKDEFTCYQCRTGDKPEDTDRKDRLSFLKTKGGIAFLVIFLLISFAILWYSYGHMNREVIMEMEGYSGTKRSEEFNVQSEADIELSEYNPLGEDPEMTVHVYDSNSDVLVCTARVVRVGSRVYRYDLRGQTSLNEGTYYLVVENSGGNYNIKIYE